MSAGSPASPEASGALASGPASGIDFFPPVPEPPVAEPPVPLVVPPVAFAPPVLDIPPLFDDVPPVDVWPPVEEEPPLPDDPPVDASGPSPPLLSLLQAANTRPALAINATTPFERHFMTLLPPHLSAVTDVCARDHKRRS